MNTYRVTLTAVNTTGVRQVFERIEAEDYREAGRKARFLATPGPKWAVVEVEQID